MFLIHNVSFACYLLNLLALIVKTRVMTARQSRVNAVITIICIVLADGQLRGKKIVLVVGNLLGLRLLVCCKKWINNLQEDGLEEYKWINLAIRIQKKWRLSKGRMRMRKRKNLIFFILYRCLLLKIRRSQNHLDSICHIKTSHIWSRSPTWIPHWIHLLIRVLYIPTRQRLAGSPEPLPLLRILQVNLLLGIPRIHQDSMPSNLLTNFHCIQSDQLREHKNSDNRARTLHRSKRGHGPQFLCTSWRQNPSKPQKCFQVHATRPEPQLQSSTTRRLVALGPSRSFFA